MNTLVLLFILWVVSKVLFGKGRGRFPQPTVPQQEEEFPSYRLPPDLRGKWGRKDEEVRHRPRDEEIVLAEPPVEPRQYKIAKAPQTSKAPDIDKTKHMPVVNPAPTVRGNQLCPQKLFGGDELTPAMVRQGIILSEVLGPPLARRRGSRLYH